MTNPQPRSILVSLVSLTSLAGLGACAGDRRADPPIEGQAALSTAASQRVVSLTGMFGTPLIAPSAGPRADGDDLGGELLEDFLGGLDDVACATTTIEGDGAYHLELSGCVADGALLDGAITADLDVTADCDAEGTCTGSITLSFEAHVTMDGVQIDGSWSAAADFDGNGSLTGSVTAVAGDQTVEFTLDASYGADGSCEIDWSYADSAGNAIDDHTSCL